MPDEPSDPATRSSRGPYRDAPTTPPPREPLIDAATRRWIIRGLVFAGLLGLQLCRMHQHRGRPGCQVVRDRDSQWTGQNAPDDAMHSARHRVDPGQIVTVAAVRFDRVRIDTGLTGWRFSAPEDLTGCEARWSEGIAGSSIHLRSAPLSVVASGRPLVGPLHGVEECPGDLDGGIPHEADSPAFLQCASRNGTVVRTSLGPMLRPEIDWPGRPRPPAVAPGRIRLECDQGFADLAVPRE